MLRFCLIFFFVTMVVEVRIVSCVSLMQFRLYKAVDRIVTVFVNILHFVNNATCRIKQQCCCSVQWTVDYDEGATNVPNVLFCGKVSVFICLSCSLITSVCMHFQHKSCFATAV